MFTCSSSAKCNAFYNAFCSPVAIQCLSLFSNHQRKQFTTLLWVEWDIKLYTHSLNHLSCTQKHHNNTQLADTHKSSNPHCISVVSQMCIITNVTLNFDLEPRNISRISQGHSLYQVWTLWDHHFWVMLRTDKQTNKQRQISYPRRMTLSVWVINSSNNMYD